MFFDVACNVSSGIDGERLVIEAPISRCALLNANPSTCPFDVFELLRVGVALQTCKRLIGGPSEHPDYSERSQLYFWMGGASSPPGLFMILAGTFHSWSRASTPPDVQCALNDDVSTVSCTRTDLIVDTDLCQWPFLVSESEMLSARPVPLARNAGARLHDNVRAFLNFTHTGVPRSIEQHVEEWRAIDETPDAFERCRLAIVLERRRRRVCAEAHARIWCAWAAPCGARRRRPSFDVCSDAFRRACVDSVRICGVTLPLAFERGLVLGCLFDHTVVGSSLSSLDCTSRLPAVLRLRAEETVAERNVNEQLALASYKISCRTVLSHFSEPSYEPAIGRMPAFVEGAYFMTPCGDVPFLEDRLAVVVDQWNGVVYVLSRGSATKIGDWWYTNLNTPLSMFDVPSRGDTWMVHRGFNERAERELAWLLQTNSQQNLLRLVGEAHASELRFVGHSLGAAVSALLVARLVGAFDADVRVRGVGFATPPWLYVEPRVDLPFTSSFRFAWFDDHFTTYYRAHDIVPRLSLENALVEFCMCARAESRAMTTHKALGCRCFFIL
jgi:hypothetical protein